MKKIIFFAAFLAGMVTVNAQVSGSGTALDFSANIANANHVDLGGLTNINTNDFSFECWMKVNSVTEDPSFFSNKNWASGNNTGLVFDVQDNGQNMKFNFKDPNNSRKDLTIAVDVVSLGWFHFAATMNRGGLFKVYINGIAKDSIDISSITGSFESSYTYKLGQDGTGNYSYNGTNPRFDGSIDEVRIWDGVLTQQQIRDRMCLKLNGNEQSLYAYYPCDDASGTTLSDLTAASNDGSLINTVASNWETSGAALGNVSNNIYTSNWSGVTVALNSANGNFTAQQIENVSGLHVYKVNGQPSSLNGLTLLPGNDVYFGVFAVDKSAAAAYEIELNYGAFGAATTNEANLVLWNRNANNSLWWSDYLADQNLTTNIISKDSIGVSKEFYLGLVSNGTCNPPSAPSIVNQTASSCEVSWTTGGATNWNLQWGEQGFALGEGTEVLNTTNNPYNFSGLTGNVYYDLYIQDTCGGSGASSWIGPFTFYATICSVPTALSATNITSSSATLTWTSGATTFDIEWGLPGFTPGTGIPVSNVSNPYVLNQLAPTTTYSYYVRTDCGASSTSTWAGPFEFTTTINTAGLEESTEQNKFRLFPNPASDLVQLQFVEAGTFTVEVIDLFGRKVYEDRVSGDENNQTQISLELLQKGMYLVNVSTENSFSTQQLIKE
ncbi:MAG: T9SS type A sorting domain-containing protein [Fluviicola sp.]|nr:T9SS type A sorting domain-containing protein [Fluviicola sp.]